MYYKLKYDNTQIFFAYKTFYSEGRLVLYGINEKGELVKHSDYEPVFLKEYEIIALRMQGFKFPDCIVKED